MAEHGPGMNETSTDYYNHQHTAREHDGRMQNAKGSMKYSRSDSLDDLDFDDIKDDSDSESSIKSSRAGQKRKRDLSDSLATSISERRAVKLAEGDEEPGFILEDDRNTLPTLLNHVPGTFGRQDRRKGECLAAYHKRISADLDDGDKLMMDMREQNYPDRAIAEKVFAKSGIRYDSKSISTRIMRIRLAQAAHVDFLLSEGYKEWQAEEDLLLMKAHAIATVESNYEIERVRAWRWRKVSEYLRSFKKDALFSATACRERYSDIIKGNAVIPSSIDDDPETTRAERNAFCSAREEVRNKMQSEKEAQELIDFHAKSKVRTERAQKAEEIANRIAERHSETAQKLMKRAAQAQIRAQVATMNQRAKVERNQQVKRQTVEEQARFSKGKATSSDNDTTAFSLPYLKDITASTPDPRSYLSFHDLRSMCEDRGFDTSDFEKHELLEQLKDVDEEWSKEDLIKMCRTKGLAIHGTKLQLKYRIALDAAKDYPSFVAGKAAGDKEEESSSHVK